MGVVNVFAVNVPEKMAEDDYHLFLNAVCSTKKERIQRFWKAQDAYRTLLADILVRTIICERYGIINKDIHYHFNSFDKPFVQHIPDFSFNVSHSGDWVVCATHDRDVGIDIEQIRPINFKIAQRFFSAQEYRDLEEKQGDEKLEYFYDLWSLKESYIKAVGKGLNLPLHSFTVRKLANQKITFTSVSNSDIWYFKQYELDVRYKLSVCAQENHFSPMVQIERPETLRQRIARFM